MKILYSRGFIKSSKSLPKSAKTKLSSLLEILKRDLFNPKFHLKPLAGRLKGYYSIRITREWRVIFIFLDKNETIYLVNAGHRKDIYK